MKRGKILIVDDELWTGEMMQEILERDGYEATVVGSGKEALRLASRDSFDLLLTDIIMPQMGGLELVQEFREISPQTICMLVTGYASVETAQAAIRQGVYDYIVKPFDRADLCTAVNKALQRKKSTDESFRLKELVGLYRVSQSMVTSQEQREVLESVLSAAVHNTNSRGGAVLLFDISRQGLVIASALGAWEPAARVANTMLESGIDVCVERFSVPTLFTDIEHHPIRDRVQYYHTGEHPPALYSKDGEMLLIPIKSDDQMFGVLGVYREEVVELLGQSDLELLTILANQAGLSIKGRQLFSELEDGIISGLHRLASLVDGRSLYTQGHMQRVSQLSERLAHAIGLSEAEVRVIKLGASLHDIGRIGVSEAVLSAPGELSSKEWELVKRHPVIGDEILAPIRSLREVRHIVRHHHERLDGTGYPDSIQGEQITPALNVVLLADAYVALISPRPWRPALPREQALATLQEERGAKAAPEITDAFVDMIKSG